MNDSSVSPPQAASPAAYQIAPRDDVAVALRDLAAGERVELGHNSVVLLEPIPRGHKFAVR
ncbi:MAG: SAF domain-containing protein, partial [Povalibacter sp.]